MKTDVRRFYGDNRRWVMGVLILLAANVGFRLAVARVRASADVLEEQRDTSQLSLAKALQEWDRASRMRSALESAQWNAGLLYRDTLKTRKARLANVDQQLKDLAKQFGLEPTSIQYDIELLEDYELEKFTISFPLKGGYKSLREFISHIEASELFFVIERVALTDSSKQGSELNLQISIATYFAAPPEAESDRRAGRRRRS